MRKWIEYNIPRSEIQRVAVDNLKRCPLCSAINAIQNYECFVCSWHSEFDHDAYSVEEGLHDLLERCPELLDALFDEDPPMLPTRWDRICNFWSRVFRPRLNIRV